MSLYYLLGIKKFFSCEKNKKNVAVSAKFSARPGCKLDGPTRILQGPQARTMCCCRPEWYSSYFSVRNSLLHIPWTVNFLIIETDNGGSNQDADTRRSHHLFLHSSLYRPLQWSDLLQQGLTFTIHSTATVLLFLPHPFVVFVPLNFSLFWIQSTLFVFKYLLCSSFLVCFLLGIIWERK